MEEKRKEIRLSPSAILTYLRNPREFYYNYILRLHTPTSNHLIKGSVVHRVLEWFFTKRFNPKMEEHVEDLFNKAWKEREEEWNTLQFSEEKTEQERQDCINQIQLYIRTFRIKMDGLKMAKKAEDDKHAFYLLRPKFKELWIEDKDLNLCGYIDRIHTDFDGNITIGDYKTSARFGIGTKMDYVIQCGIYAYLYRKVHKRIPDFVSIIYLRYGDEVNIMVTPDLIKFAIDKVKYVRDRVMSDNIEDYPRNESDKFFLFHDIDSGLMEIEDDARRKRAIEEIKEKFGKKKK